MSELSRALEVLGMNLSRFGQNWRDRKIQEQSDAEREVERKRRDDLDRLQGILQSRTPNLPLSGENADLLRKYGREGMIEPLEEGPGPSATDVRWRETEDERQAKVDRLDQQKLRNLQRAASIIGLQQSVGEGEFYPKAAVEAMGAENVPAMMPMLTGIPQAYRPVSPETLAKRKDLQRREEFLGGIGSGALDVLDPSVQTQAILQGLDLGQFPAYQEYLRGQKLDEARELADIQLGRQKELAQFEAELPRPQPATNWDEFQLRMSQLAPDLVMPGEVDVDPLDRVAIALRRTAEINPSAPRAWAPAAPTFGTMDDLLTTFGYTGRRKPDEILEWVKKPAIQAKARARGIDLPSQIQAFLTNLGGMATAQDQEVGRLLLNMLRPQGGMR